MRISGLRFAGAVVACLAVLAAMLPADAASHSSSIARAAESPRAATDSEVLHRVVWDELRRGRKGIHLRSALADGTDRRPVYDSARGWTMELSLDRSGQWVAFSPCCRSELPLLVVAPVLGGEVLEPLANHPRIYSVGGIGWSPDGRRIAFEGWHGKAPHHHKSIWTIRPDGSGLRKILERPRGRFDASNTLAWTSEGILIISGWNLVSVKRGETKLIMRRVYGLRMSGDGTTLVTKRESRAGQSIWISSTDGSGRRRLVGPFSAGDEIWYDDVIPNYDASALLSYVDVPADETGGSQNYFVTWSTGEDPGSAVPFDLINGGGYPATWN